MRSRMRETLYWACSPWARACRSTWAAATAWAIATGCAARVTRTVLRSQAHATIRGAAMKHVMVSYKREDEPRVARLVRALIQHGLTLW